MKIMAVVLAAGGGSRFHGGTHKLMAPLRGRPVVTHAVENARAADLDATLVVSGAVEFRLADLTGADLESTHLPGPDLRDPGLRGPDFKDSRSELILAHNPNWSGGQASSLQVAVAVARNRGFDAIVVGLGDQPFVPPETWRTIALTEGQLVVAVMGGHRTPPVKIARSQWPDLPTSGDAGARVLLKRRPDLVVPVVCPGNPVDIDTVEDLAEWN